MYDTLQRSLHFVESQCTYTYEQKYVRYVAALKNALEKVCGTKFKNKKDKQQLLRKYQRKLEELEEQYRVFQAQAAIKIAHKKEILRQQYVQQTFTYIFPALEDDIAHYLPLIRKWYTQYCSNIVSYFDARAEALSVCNNSSAYYSIKLYVLSTQVQQLLQDTEIAPRTFTQCYGNAYQQCIHQESLMILDEVATIAIDSILYQHRKVLVTFAEVAVEYNNAGLSYYATTILDFCWSLLSWGGQIIEGAAEGTVPGVVGAVTDIIEHPIATGVSVALGSSVMLTYQLSKIVYAVADLGITTLIDPVAGQQKWDTYLEPMNNLLDAIDKKQIGLKEASKAVTQFGVQWYIQAKLLGGLRNFYDGIKIKAVSFLQANSSVISSQYFATPDGALMKVATDVAHQPFHDDCPASCVNQYEKLREALNIEQFTSIIKVTKHGIQRLIDRGFTPEEVKALVTKPDYFRIQTDGAKVFIQKIIDKYRVIIVNEVTGKVVTAIKGTTEEKIVKLGENYGWKL